MGTFMNLCLALVGMLCTAQGQTFTILRKFVNGKLIFTWSNISTNHYDITITKDSHLTGLIRVENNQYTVEDVMQYKSVSIKVREYKTSNLSIYMDYRKTFKVSLAEARIGDSKNISWIAASFPKSGLYNIYHMYKESKENIIKINEKVPTPSAKYIYYSRPYNSTNIIFEVKDINSRDAGFYTGGQTTSDAGSGEGAILVVKNKPTKPVIKGNLRVPINTTAILTCFSTSTSVPDYYSRIVTWWYLWFVNNTNIIGENSATYRFNVEKSVKYNNYSCQSQERFKSIQSDPSDLSDQVQIKPLYGPDSVIISPWPPLNDQNRVTLREGEKFGPYTCSADCNPPCTIQWKRKRYREDFHNIEPAGRNLSERVDKDIESFQCVAKWNNAYPVIVTKEKINMDVQYLRKPNVFLNGKNQNHADIKEGHTFHISCLVDGNPTPTISISRASQSQILEQKDNLWLNYTKTRTHCSDTDTYRCRGNATQFWSKNTDFTVNVGCDPRLDTSVSFKTDYWFMIEQDIKVVVRVPVLANPSPSTSSISWEGPGYLNIANTVEERERVIYKHWINSTIPITDQGSFGRYSMMYDGKAIVNITINAEDIPKSPLNFTWNSYGDGHINFTWISNFNGGPEQFFILSQKKGSSWTKITNLTDPGEGNLGYYDLGPLTPGQEFWYQLESCNRINCSLSPTKLKVRIPALPASSSSSRYSVMVIVIGCSLIGFLIAVILTSVLVMYFRRKKSDLQERNSDERTSGYDQKTMYSEVTKSSNMPNQRDGRKEKKNNGQEDELTENTEATNGNEETRTLNQDDLVYIDVEFAKNSPTLDTKGRPVVHGEEEKTEYMFVDFSKKAPPTQET